MDIKTESRSRNVLAVDITPEKEEEVWILLTGDRHHDNLLCRRDKELRHLKQAKERNALIIDVGDLFCAMQGKYDPRSDLSQIRQEDAAPDYLDRIVLHAAEFYEPYAKNFLLLGHGNHETKVLERHGFDLTSNLVHSLNRLGGNVYSGFYGGWVALRFHSYSNDSPKTSRLLKYFHGAGGGGAVTRGVIQSNRQAVYLPDADIIVNGHTHDAWHVPISRERINRKLVIWKDIAHHIRTPGYKDAYNDGATGWDVQTWKPPKPIGCAWLKYTFSSKESYTEQVIIDVE